jgi:hypothetical protein
MAGIELATTEPDFAAHAETYRAFIKYTAVFLAHVDVMLARRPTSASPREILRAPASYCPILKLPNL